MPRIKTVKIIDENTERGFKIINESDMTEDDVLFGEEKSSGGDMTKAQLKDELTKLEVEFPSSANKGELQKLLDDKLAE